MSPLNHPFSHLPQPSLQPSSSFKYFLNPQEKMNRLDGYCWDSAVEARWVLVSSPAHGGTGAWTVVRALAVCKVALWVSGWLGGWLGDWLSEWMIGWVGGWLVEWVGDWLSGWVIGWVGGWLVEWVGDWLSGWVIGWVSGWVSCF